MTPVFISVDTIDRAAALTKKYEIPFPVLSDPQATVHDAFGVTKVVGQEELERLRGYGIEIELWSKLAHHKIAVPALFLVDAGGILRWTHAQQNHRERPSIEQILAVVDGLDLSQEAREGGSN